VRYAFEVLKADHLISIIHPRDAAWIRVALRIGEKLKRRMEFLGASVKAMWANRMT